MTDNSRFDPIASTTQPKPRRRWLRRFVITFALLFGGLAVAYGLWYRSALSARDAEIAKLRAAGEPVWFSDLKPAPLDPAEDGTPLLQQAFAAMKPLPDELLTELNDLTAPDEEPMDPDEEQKFLDEHGDDPVEPLGITLREFLAQHDKPKPAGPRLPLAVREKLLVEKLRPHVEANREAFAALRKALEKPKFQFPIDYDHPSPIELEFPELAQLQHLGRLIEARWRCEMFDGDMKSGEQTLDELLKLNRGMVATDQPTLVFLLVNAARTGATLEIVAETLGRGRITDDRRTAWMEILAEIESATKSHSALRGERAMVMSTLEGFVAPGEPGRPSPNNWFAQWVNRPFIWENQTNYLRCMSAIVDYADRYDDEAAQAIDEVYVREWLAIESGQAGAYEKWTRSLQAIFAPAVGPIDRSVVASRNRLRAAQVALWVDAFRHEHGRLPKSLDEIPNHRLPEIPRDVVQQKPLAYVTAENAFAICPADETDREQRQLAEAVKRRNAATLPGTTNDKAADKPDEPADDEAQDDETDDEVNDDGSPTGAFRVVYMRPLASP